MVIQTLLLSLNGQGPLEMEVNAYCGRLAEILDAGGRIARRVPALGWPEHLPWWRLNHSPSQDPGTNRRTDPPAGSV